MAKQKEDRGRFSSKRKMEAVLRLLKGETLDAVSRDLGVTAAKLSEWRDEFLRAAEAGLKSREPSVATLDNAGKVAGYVEYEPHGFTNRAYVAKTVAGPTAAPFNTVFPVVTTSTVGASTAISALNSEVVSGRALLFNTDLAISSCTNPGQVLLNGTTALTQKGAPLKWAWTNWVQLTPTTPTTAPGGQPATVTARGDCSASPTVTPYYVEFRRSQKAVPHVFVPLRAPGQYFDEETHLFENWNRYYDPFKGVYLQPDPMLHQPKLIAIDTLEGAAPPNAYAYARSNPVAYMDADGRYSWITKCDAPYGPGMDTLQSEVRYDNSTVNDKTGCLDCKEVTAGADKACKPPVLSPEYCACAKKLAAEVCSTMGQTANCTVPPRPKKLPQRENPRPVACEFR